MLQKAKATKIILCKFITTRQLQLTNLFTSKYVQLGMAFQFAFLNFQAGYFEASFHYTDNIPVRAEELNISTETGGRNVWVG